MSKELRLAFWKKKAKLEALEAKVKPLRDKYDKLTQKYHADIRPLIDALKVEEKPIFELKQEIANIVRQLGGQTALQPGDK